MIDSQHHIKLNGVKYKLAVSGGNEHYSHRQEPLRPPNSVMVQGQDRQDLFQVRPDVLLWSLSDWSGGEGQYKYDFTNAGRHAILRNVDPFARPGTLRPGPKLDVTTRASDGAAFTAGVILVPHNEDQLWGVSMFFSGAWFVWDDVNEEWGAAQFHTGDAIADAPAPDGLTSDGQYLYYLEDTAANVFKISNSSVSDQMNGVGNVVPDAANSSLRELGDYIYAITPSQGKVREMAKTESGAGAWTLLDDLGWGGSANYADYSNQYQVAVSENRLYYMFAREGGRTEIREVTPTSAAGPGSTASLAVIHGTVGTGLWYHGGMLYMTAWNGSLRKGERALFYIDPSNGSYGVVDRVIPEYIEDGAFHPDGRMWGNEAGSSLAASHFIMWDDASIAGRQRLYKFYPPTGGIAQISSFGRGQVGEKARAPLYWQGDVFLAMFTTGGSNLYRAAEGTYIDSDDATEGIYFASPWHDFGLADQKILSSVSLVTEEMPADWQLEVYYALDGDPDYTLVGTLDTDGATGEKFSISTSSSTTLFRTLQIKVKWVYTGAADPITTAPVLLSVDVKAMVAQPQHAWTLMLDLSDDLAATQQRRRGNEKVDNLVTAGDTATVVEFVDGYGNRENGQITTHNVVIDSYNIVLDRAGEGFAQVVLRETA